LTCPAERETGQESRGIALVKVWEGEAAGAAKSKAVMVEVQVGLVFARIVRPRPNTRGDIVVLMKNVQSAAQLILGGKDEEF
jgi:hypothetical protein